MAVYVTGVIIVCLFIMGLLFVVQYAVIDQIRTSTVTAMNSYNVANSSYTNWALADTFMFNVWSFFLVFVVVILAYWVYIYQQRKGAPIYK